MIMTGLLYIEHPIGWDISQMVMLAWTSWALWSWAIFKSGRWPRNGARAAGVVLKYVGLLMNYLNTEKDDQREMEDFEVRMELKERTMQHDRELPLLRSQTEKSTAAVRTTMQVELSDAKHRLLGKTTQTDPKAASDPKCSIR
jgi:hypothetical protein